MLDDNKIIILRHKTVDSVKHLECEPVLSNALDEFAHMTSIVPATEGLTKVSLDVSNLFSEDPVEFVPQRGLAFDPSKCPTLDLGHCEPPKDVITVVPKAIHQGTYMAYGTSIEDAVKMHNRVVKASERLFGKAKKMFFGTDDEE